MIRWSGVDQFAKVRHRIQEGTAEAASVEGNEFGITPQNKNFYDYVMMKTTKNDTIRELYKKW